MSAMKINLYTFFGNALLIGGMASLAACSGSRQLQTSAPSINPMQEALQQILQEPSLQQAHLGISIYDAGADSFLLQYQGEKYFVPASNTKIVTCYAAMKWLGDSTLSFRYAELDTAIFLEPAGDPSFMHRDFRTQPVIDWLKSQKKPLYLIGKHWQTTAWGSGWSWGDYESAYMAERSPLPIYGNTIRWEQVIALDPYDNSEAKLVSSDPPTDWPVSFSLDNPDGSFKVKRALAENHFTIYEGNEDNPVVELPFVTNGMESARQLLSDSLQKPVGYREGYLPKSLEWKPLYSQALDSVLKPLMHRSDNFIAEQLLLMLSYKATGVLNERLATDTLLKTIFSDLSDAPRWADGSGLSRYNLFTPRSLVHILKKLRSEMGMERVKEIFPAGGEGTLRGYYVSEQPYLYAKTGTLSGVVALSGYMNSASGKPLIFSVLVNNNRASASEVRRAVERFLLEVRGKY